MFPTTPPSIPTITTKQPIKILVLGCLMIASVFVESGVVVLNSVNGSPRTKENPEGQGLQGDLELSNFEDGLFFSVFMIGFLIGSPIFSSATRYFNMIRVLGVAGILWIIALIICGVSTNVYLLMIMRTIEGMGIGGNHTIWPAVIDEISPPNRKGLWMSIYISGCTTGLGIGSIVGEFLTFLFGWRGALIGTSLLALPFAVICLIIPTPLFQRRQEYIETDLENKSQLHVFWNDIQVLFSHKIVVTFIIGGILYIGVFNTEAYWAARGMDAMFNEKNIDLWYGLIYSSSGFIGTLLGGLIFDLIGTTLPNAFLMNCVPCLMSGLIAMINFLCVQNFYVFVTLYAIGLTLKVATRGPFNGALMWAVPKVLRPLVMCAALELSHLFGDILSPALFGLNVDLLTGRFQKTEDMAFRITFVLAECFIIMEAFVCLFGIVQSKTSKDYREETAESLVNNARHDRDVV